MRPATREAIFVIGVYPVGAHLAGWRHPSAYDDIVMNLDHMIEIAELAEVAKFHALFIADTNGVVNLDRPALFEATTPFDRPSCFEPLTVMAAISQHTRHVGLFCTATTTYDEPYSVARRFASLDHISNGRAIWNVVTGSNPADSLNFGVDEHAERVDRYERATEFVEVCKGLWNSWDEGAFPQDKSSGRFVDRAKVRVLDHHGKHFSVQGPLNISRPPQGYPVLFMAGQSDPGREIAAKHADCLFTIAQTKEESIALYDDVKGRMAAYGRDPDEMKVIPTMTPFIGRTTDEAYQLVDELTELITPALGVDYLGKLLDTDLSRYPLDGPLPDLSAEVLGITSIRKSFYEMAVADDLTIRETYERILGRGGKRSFTGSACEIVDEIQDWVDSGACDGFNVNMPTLPLGIERWIELITPELQARGLLHEDYRGGTLREELGLAIPPNPCFPRASVP